MRLPRLTLVGSRDVIPCVIVLDQNARQTADDLEREAEKGLPNIKKVFCLEKGNIEDYYPLEIVAEVINREFDPNTQVTEDDFDSDLSGQDRLNDFQRVMHEHGAGDSIRYLKKHLGGLGARLMKQSSLSLDPELIEIFMTIKTIADTE